MSWWTAEEENAAAEAVKPYYPNVDGFAEEWEHDVRVTARAALNAIKVRPTAEAPKAATRKAYFVNTDSFVEAIEQLIIQYRAQPGPKPRLEMSGDGFSFRISDPKPKKAKVVR